MIIHLKYKIFLVVCKKKFSYLSAAMKRDDKVKVGQCSSGSAVRLNESTWMSNSGDKSIEMIVN